MTRLVDAGDLDAGWLCESCDQPFTVGDTATPQSVTDDVFGESLSFGWQCTDCAGLTGEKR